ALQTALARIRHRARGCQPRGHDTLGLRIRAHGHVRSLDRDDLDEWRLVRHRVAPVQNSVLGIDDRRHRDRWRLGNTLQGPARLVPPKWPTAPGALTTATLPGLHSSTTGPPHGGQPFAPPRARSPPRLTPTSKTDLPLRSAVSTIWRSIRARTVGAGPRLIPQ